MSFWTRFSHFGGANLSGIKKENVSTYGGRLLWKGSSFYTYGRPTPPLIMVIDRYILLSPLTYSILVLSSFIEDNAWFKCGGVDILVLI